MHKYIKRLKQTNHQVTHPSFTWNHEFYVEQNLLALWLRKKKEEKLKYLALLPLPSIETICIYISLCELCCSVEEYWASMLGKLYRPRFTISIIPSSLFFQLSLGLVFAFFRLIMVLGLWFKKKKKEKNAKAGPAFHFDVPHWCYFQLLIFYCNWNLTQFLLLTFL